jgi:hypothetical protein
MSKCTEIRDICGDYAFDVEYSENNKFTMFFNSRRNAETVKRCIEVDDSIPNVATAVDFVEVVRCKDCIHSSNMPLGLCYLHTEPYDNAKGYKGDAVCVEPNDYCSYGERREE